MQKKNITFRTTESVHSTIKHIAYIDRTTIHDVLQRMVDLMDDDKYKDEDKNKSLAN